MQDRRTREKSKHAPRATIILLVSLIICIAFQGSFEFFVSIHLLVFGCPLFEGSEGCRPINSVVVVWMKFAMLILGSYFSDIRRLRAFRVNTIDSV